MPFKMVARADEVAEGEMAGRVVDGTKVLLVRLGGEVHAYEDRCRHMGVPLSRGDLEASTLTCFLHGWSYDASTGACLSNPSECLRCFAVRVEGDEVWVDVGEPG